MNILMDLLVLPKGPRVRDRVSHGEIDFSSALASSQGPVPNSCDIIVKLIRDVLDGSTVQSCYRSIYHPIPLTVAQLRNGIQLLQEVTLFSKETEPRECGRKLKFSKECDMLLGFEFSEVSAARFVEVCEEYEPSTVHRPKPELDLVRAVGLVREEFNKNEMPPKCSISAKTGGYSA